MMAKYRMVQAEFWTNPVFSEEMTPEDKYFYLYLLTNPQTTQIGIYKITRKQMALDLGYSLESVQALMDRFIQHHKLIRYNPETRELAIKNWGKYNLHKAGKPVMDCIISELKGAEDPELIQYVAESILKDDIRCLFESCCNQEEMFFIEESDEDENDTYREPECEDVLDIENHTNSVILLQNHQQDVQAIIKFWDTNGFGFTNVNAKEQLLSWLDDSTFLQPKEMILKAMNIACANNKRRLSYVVGILKNWENESILTVEEVDSYQENQKHVPKPRKSTEYVPGGRPVPGRFVLDLTDGDE